MCFFVSHWFDRAPCGFQEEYRREQLEWTFIQFPDNGDCIILIEKKPNGIIPTLDEQCIIGRATDDRFARELYKKSESNSRCQNADVNYDC